MQSIVSCCISQSSAKQGLVVRIMSMKLLHVICCPSVVSPYGCCGVQHSATKAVLCIYLDV